MFFPFLGKKTTIILKKKLLSFFEVEAQTNSFTMLYAAEHDENLTQRRAQGECECFSNYERRHRKDTACLE